VRAVRAALAPIPDPQSAGYIITQDYKKSGARNRPYQTVRSVCEARVLS
jgi:hypothetical protein